MVVSGRSSSAPGRGDREVQHLGSQVVTALGEIALDGTIEEKEARRGLKATARELTGVIAAITNERAKSLRNRLVNAVVLKVGGAGAATGAFGLASLVGTAGTGTAIGTLSGAAANSATLAWLGFGSMAVGTLVVPAIMVAGGFVLLKAWKGKVRPPESLTGAERELVSACAGMAVGIEEQLRSGRPVSRDELALVLTDVLRPLAQRLSGYRVDEDFAALRLRNRIALRVHAGRLDHQIAITEGWCDA